jgi:hypothetical protein
MYKEGLLTQPKKLAAPHNSVMVYSDATPSAIGIYWPAPPAEHQYRQYEDYKPIVFAETATALVALIHTANN